MNFTGPSIFFHYNPHKCNSGVRARHHIFVAFVFAVLTIRGPENRKQGKSTNSKGKNRISALMDGFVFVGSKVLRNVKPLKSEENLKSFGIYFFAINVDSL